jgi:hypothetical protein
MHPEWARSLRDRCVAAGVPFFFKQWGEWLPGHHYTPELRERDPGYFSRYESAGLSDDAWAHNQNSSARRLTFYRKTHGLRKTSVTASAAAGQSRAHANRRRNAGSPLNACRNAMSLFGQMVAPGSPASADRAHVGQLPQLWPRRARAVSVLPLR